MIKLTNEELFLSELKTLINNLIINNINYSNGVYDRSCLDLIEDNKDRGQFILDKIESMEHLILHN